MKRFQNWILLFIGLLLGLFILKGVTGAWNAGNLSVKQVLLSAIGNGLKTDENNLTNILLVGVGGDGHDGENLTDTMLVASINNTENTVSMLSIPRDLYVESEAVSYGSRINSIYEIVYDTTENDALAEAALEKEIENITGVDIHYFVKIDFKGFVKLVDALGGIEIAVKESIYDSSYPKGENGLTEIFSLQEGLQILDGETALKYVRSRHNTSDFSRAARQQEMLGAIKEKALDKGWLGNPSTVKKVYSAIASNIVTNMSLSDMLALAELASDLDTQNIQRGVISDVAYETGGFLYTPPRELDTDPYYLVPYLGEENFAEIRLFAELLFKTPRYQSENVQIYIRNGTAQNGLAGLTKMLLVRNGFTVIDYGNADSKTLTQTSLYWAPKNTTPEAEETELPLQSIQALDLVFGTRFHFVSPLQTLPAPTLEPTAEDPKTITGNGLLILDLGADFLDFYHANKDRFYLGYY